MSEEPDLKIQVLEGHEADGTYKYSFCYERATLYEYKYVRLPYPDPIDPCHRCYKRISPDQQVNVGILFHRECFRCRICGLPLTMQTFYRNDANGSFDKEVYCKTHVGKLLSQVTRDKDILDIDDGMPPENKYVIQVKGSNRPSIQAAPVASPRGSPRPSPRGTPKNRSPASSMTNITPRSLNGTPSVSFMTMSPYSGEYSTMSAGILGKVIPVLQSYEDFANSGVFEAEATLEQRHHEEEMRLQRFLSEEREKEMHRLDDTVAFEKEKAAADLLNSIDQMSIQQNPAMLMAERDRIEDHFRRVKDDKMKGVMDKIDTEEKGRTSKMLERHGQEIMLLIAEKDREADRNALFDHSMRPPIVPPDTKKSALYKSPSIFEQLDKRAIELTNRDYSCFTNLVRDLTHGCQNELEKARVIFRWVIAKDLNKHDVKEIIRHNSNGSLLKGVKSGKETYHQLFKKLCNYAGLHCEIILGYSKGAGYKPGMRVDGNAFRNSWTAVAIDGDWRIVNCTWAARHVTGHKDDLPQIFHKYDEFYFLTDPDDYIYQHYPDDPIWQLLEIPLPFSEFLNLPVVKSPFFNYGLRFYSNYGATLTTDSGVAEVRLIAPKIMGFGSLLESYDKSVDSRLLDGRVLLRLIKNEAIFTVNVPRTGLYYFSIYTGDYWQSECLESACSFLVNCTKLMGAPSPQYPPVPFYGPTPILEQLKIIPENQLDPLIVFNGDSIEIIFKMPKEIKTTHTFQYFDADDGTISDTDRHVFLRSRSDVDAKYLVRCPKEGQYIFSLYAANSLDESQNLDCVYRYLIICQEASTSGTVFPKTYQRWQRCTLYEPVSGDLMIERRYNFKVDVPQAVEVFVVIGEIWYHLKRKTGFTWEGSLHTGKTSGTAKIYARFSAERDSSIFAHLLDYELVEEGETEI